MNLPTSVRKNISDIQNLSKIPKNCEHIQFTQSTYLKFTQQTDLYYKRFVHERKYVQFATQA